MGYQSDEIGILAPDSLKPQLNRPTSSVTAMAMIASQATSIALLHAAVDDDLVTGRGWRRYLAKSLLASAGAVSEVSRRAGRRAGTQKE